MGKEKQKKVAIKFTIAWSLDEKHIFLYDETEQYNLIDIQINAKWKKQSTIEIIKEMVKHL